jgi:glucose/arabinose dehydrogenase
MLNRKTPVPNRGFFVRVPISAAVGMFATLGIACDSSSPEGCDRRIEVPDGFCVTLFADDVGPARHLAVSRSGTVYAALWREGQRTGGILALRDTSGDGIADVRRSFGTEGGSGIAVRDSLLYHATWSTVYRYTLRDNEAVPQGEPEMVVTGMPETEHGARSITLGPNRELYVNVGVPSNACERNYPARDFRGQEPCEELRTGGGIWLFDAMGSGQAFDESHRYATGLRHTVALTSRSNGEPYGAPHGIDHLDRWWPSAGYSREQAASIPSETLFRIDSAGDYGFPYCMHDPRSGEMVLTPAYAQAPAYGERCPGLPKPAATFTAHSAPLALLFYSARQFPERYRDGLFVALHGSLFHAPLSPAGYSVAFLPSSRITSSGPVETCARGARRSIGNLRSQRIRPSGLAVDSAGALYISDDNSGRIWRIRWKPQSPN